MKFVVFSALSLVSAARAFRIGLPENITACDPFTIQYNTGDGIAPFSLSFHSDSAGGSVLAAFTNVTGTSYTWDLVTIPAGTNVVITLGDSSGKGSSTPLITVGQGNSDVCLNNPTSIPVIPSVTTTYPPIPSGSSLSGSSTLPLVSVTPVIIPAPPSTSHSSSTGSTTVTTSTSPSATTSGLSTDGGVVNAASVFTIGAISAIFGALLA